MRVLGTFVWNAGSKQGKGQFQRTWPTSMSGNSVLNFSISSSPVTFTAVSLCAGGLSKSSNEKPELATTVGCECTGMSASPSSEMSGKADAARSKSMSSAPDWKKSDMVCWQSEAMKCVNLVTDRGNLGIVEECLSTFLGSLYRFSSSLIRVLFSQV
jgi:hypothetical protein